MDQITEIPKRYKHSHFWIENEILYESYQTVRGLRFMERKEVPGMPDEDNCSEECLNYIVKEYYNP
jgi:hypothetical protein